MCIRLHSDCILAVVEVDGKQNKIYINTGTNHIQSIDFYARVHVSTQIKGKCNTVIDSMTRWMPQRTDDWHTYQMIGTDARWSWWRCLFWIVPPPYGFFSQDANRLRNLLLTLFQTPPIKQYALYDWFVFWKPSLMHTQSFHAVNKHS